MDLFGDPVERCVACRNGLSRGVCKHVLTAWVVIVPTPCTIARSRRVLAPHDGMVIGKGMNPSGGEGSRVCHFGHVGPLPEDSGAEAKPTAINYMG